MFTTGSGIPAALIRAHDRSVEVCPRCRSLDALRAPRRRWRGVAAAGIPIWIDASATVAHEKAPIIDRRVTIMGSYNWSKGGAFNSEDMNVVTWSEVAETYAKHWQARQTVSVRFADASQWCRRDDRAGSAWRQRYRRWSP
jgi:phosphatidylserine/phosphatidylglycerophosphate/cardiolipin synthase-like enzyme